MSTLDAVRAPARVAERTTRGAADRMKALGRAELTLLGRNKSAMFTVLALPSVLTLSMHSAVKSLDLKQTGLTIGTVLLPGALGYVLLFAVYSTLTGVYVIRREELVLKRLRTGELRDLEILAGAALPAVLIGLAQSVLLVVGGSVLMGVAAPGTVWLAAVGLLLGMGLMGALAAATAALTNSAEGAQVAVLPMMMLSIMRLGHGRTAGRAARHAGLGVRTAAAEPGGGHDQERLDRRGHGRGAAGTARHGCLDVHRGVGRAQALPLGAATLRQAETG